MLVCLSCIVTVSTLIFDIHELSTVQWIGVALFLWSSWEQSVIAHRLAQTRIGASGKGL